MKLVFGRTALERRTCLSVTIINYIFCFFNLGKMRKKLRQRKGQKIYFRLFSVSTFVSFSIFVHHLTFFLSLKYLFCFARAFWSVFLWTCQFLSFFVIMFLGFFTIHILEGWGSFKKIRNYFSHRLQFLTYETMGYHTQCTTNYGNRQGH